MELTERFIREVIQTFREMEEGRTGTILRELQRLNAQAEEGGQRLAEQVRMLSEVQQYLQEDRQALREIARHLQNYQAVLDYQLAHPGPETLDRMRELRKHAMQAGSLLDPNLVGVSALNNRVISSDTDPVSTRAKDFTQFAAEQSSAELDNTGVVVRTGVRESLAASTVQELDDGVTSTPSLAQQMRLVSTSASDTSGGTGIQSVRVYYINAFDQIATEVVTLNGTTAVNTSVSDIKQVNALVANAVGTGGFAAGTISLQNTGGTTTFSQITAGQNSWRSARFFVPTGSNAYVYAWSVGIINGSVRFNLDASTQIGFTAPLIERTVLFSNDGQLNQLFPIPIKVGGPGRITVRANNSGGTSADVSTAYTLLLLNTAGTV